MNNFMKIFLGIAVCYGIPQPPEPPYALLPRPAPQRVDILLTGLAVHHDEQGCCLSCGYSYCPSLDTCVRPWETYCQELDFPYNALYKGSGIILPPNKKSTSINNAV